MAVVLASVPVGASRHAELWRVDVDSSFFRDASTADLEGALVAAASMASNVSEIVVFAPERAVHVAEYYASSGAVEAVDRFLTPRLEWSVAREPFFDGSAEIALTFEAWAVELAEEWRAHQFGPKTCEAVVTVGQLSSLGATIGKVGHLGMDALRRGFALQTPMTTDTWYMAQGSDTWCGAARGTFECFFLPWNACPTRAALETMARSAAAPETRAVAKRMLGPTNNYSGRGAVFAGTDAVLCDKSTPHYRRCPPHTNRCARAGDGGGGGGEVRAAASPPPPTSPSTRACAIVNPFDLAAVPIEGPIMETAGEGRRPAHPVAEKWDSDRRLSLLHRALWLRPSWRLRNASQVEEAAFYASAPGFLEAATAGKCAFVHIRHGDKMYDRWLKLHKTRAFAVDLPDYVSEAIPLLELVGSEPPHQIVLMSDDGDMVADADARSGLGF